MKAKYASQGNESGDPLAQCQKDLADWQNRYLAKDQEAKMLATQLGVLTNVIQTQGLNLPSSAPPRHGHHRQQVQWPLHTLPLVLATMIGITGETLLPHGEARDPRS
jgi:hypothetical protein